ncbi:inositol monophosphatase family protein [Umezawaea sp. NPDC059074]|uniref:inositol monophosphatase family protein n=1 Tax=Umezawaea sp. NPDC059074 TaxID=3346716 RepID=UPI00369F4CF9
MSDNTLLAEVVTIVETAGELLRERFTAEPPHLDDREQVVAAIHANDEAVLDLLREPLLAARPGAGWVEDELEGGELPAGEWWVVDPAEGNINHIHGLTDWGLTATLVRDNQPVLTVVHLPLAGTTYTAIAGGGAYQDGVPLSPSAKKSFDCAMVGTGQAKPGESAETYRRIGESVTAVLATGAAVRVSVPATLQLIHVAAGRMDVFWQFSDVRSGLVAGALLVAEAGGVLTDVRGEPWSVGSESVLATAPGLHGEAVELLGGVR